MILKVLQVIDGYAFLTQTYPISLWENIEDSIFNCQILIKYYPLLYCSTSYYLNGFVVCISDKDVCRQDKLLKHKTDERKSMPTFSHHSFYAII